MTAELMAVNSLAELYQQLVIVLAREEQALLESVLADLVVIEQDKRQLLARLGAANKAFKFAWPMVQDKLVTDADLSAAVAKLKDVAGCCRRFNDLNRRLVLSLYQVVNNTLLVVSYANGAQRIYGADGRLGQVTAAVRHRIQEV